MRFAWKFLRMETTKISEAPHDAPEKLLLVTRELVRKNKILKMLPKLYTRETREAKAESQVIEQQSLTKVMADAAYDLFRQLICGEAQSQWDHIIKDMHKKDTGINGAKTKSLCLWNWASSKDCIELYKLTVFTCDAA
jgi:hypothetical protein